jgi:uncharacterized protein (TIGR02996 family)
MNQAGGLLEAVLEQPEEPAHWLILADWLEEQGDADSLVRAELLRLRTEWANAAGDDTRQKKADKSAVALLTERPALIGALHPLLERRFRVLASPRALALFLLADHAAIVPRPLTAGSTWEGELIQRPYAFPTTLWLRKRDGNRFEGDMKEDFRALYGSAVKGTFYFRGVVAGPHVAFVTWRMRGAAAGPGLYQFRVSQRKRWTGTWGVGDGTRHGKMWLKPKQAATKG